MKKNFCLLSVLASLIAVSVLAQDTTPAAGAPAPSASATRADSPPEHAAKPSRKRATGIKSRVVMNPPSTAVIKGGTVNVRGRPSFIGEVVGHVQKDETVTVLEEITLNHPPTGEPPMWYKIVMPTNIPVWVDADYIDAATKAVKARRVNLRGGPGENYSVVGRLEKGAPIEELRHEKGWVSIAAPTNAYGFVAAELVELQAAAAPIAEAPVPTPTPETVAVSTPAAPVAATNEPTAVPATNEPAPAPATPVAPAPTAQTETAQELAALHQATPTEPTPSATAAAPAPVSEETAGPRIVTREGFVHKSYNIQSPADYELHDIKTGALIEYLQPQVPKNFKIYVGTRVNVTGSEIIDSRWPRTPVLRVQSVDLVP